MKSLALRNLSSIFAGRHQIMRLLMVVCFFQFSGLNHCYAYVMAVSPVNTIQSLSLAGSTFVGSTTKLVTIQGVYSSLKGAMKLSTKIVIKVGSILDDEARYEKRSYRGEEIEILQSLEDLSLLSADFDAPPVFKDVYQGSANRPLSYVGQNFKTKRKEKLIHVLRNLGVSTLAQSVSNSDLSPLRTQEWLGKSVMVVQQFILGRMHTRSDEDASGIVMTQTDSMNHPSFRNLGVFFGIQILDEIMLRVTR